MNALVIFSKRTKQILAWTIDSGAARSAPTLGAILPKGPDGKVYLELKADTMQPVSAEYPNFPTISLTDADLAIASIAEEDQDKLRTSDVRSLQMENVPEPKVLGPVPIILPSFAHVTPVSQGLRATYTNQSILVDKQCTIYAASASKSVVVHSSFQVDGANSVSAIFPCSDLHPTIVGTLEIAGYRTHSFKIP
jgi:hypothetical protein